MARQRPLPDESRDKIEAIKSWVRSWVDYELSVDGHIFRRMVLSALASIPLDIEGDNDDVVLDSFDPNDLLHQRMNGDPDVHGVLCAIAALYLRDGKQMPPRLNYYIARNLQGQFVMPPPHRRGGSHYKKMARDHLIYLLVNRLGGSGHTALSQSRAKGL